MSGNFTTVMSYAPSPALPCAYHRSHYKYLQSTSMQDILSRDLPVPLLFSAVSVVSPWPQLPIPHPPAGILPFLDVSSIRDTGYRLARIAREDCAFMGPEGVLAKVMIVCLCRRGFPPSMPDWLRYQPGNCFVAMDKMGYTRVFLGQNRA